jgi:hypothetical protein
LTQRSNGEQIEYARLRYEKVETSLWRWPEGEPTRVFDFSFTDPAGQRLTFSRLELKQWEPLD